MMTPTELTYLKDFAATIQSAVTILTLVLGSIAGYYKFLKGRLFHSRMELSMSSILLTSPIALIKVNAKIKNTGLSAIFFDLDSSALQMFAMKQDHSTTTDQLAWERLLTLDFTDQHTWIEPGETIEVNWLLKIGDDAVRLAYRAQLIVAGKSTVWKADSIAAPAPAPAAQLSIAHSATS